MFLNDKLIELIFFSLSFEIHPHAVISPHHRLSSLAHCISQMALQKLSFIYPYSKNNLLDIFLTTFILIFFFFTFLIKLSFSSVFLQLFASPSSLSFVLLFLFHYFSLILSFNYSHFYFPWQLCSSIFHLSPLHFLVSIFRLSFSFISSSPSFSLIFPSCLFPPLLFLSPLTF